MNREHEINWWKKFVYKGEKLGYRVAAEAESIVSFLEGLKNLNGIFSTDDFDNYIEGLVRGYQINEQDYEECHIKTTHDLHTIEFTSFGLDYFIDYIKEETYWKNRIDYAYYDAKVFT
jgi:hypothetical protein